MRKITLLLTLLLLGALAWGGYWLLGARSVETALAGWLEARRAEGWVAAADISVTGFPDRFDTAVTGLELADPDTQVGWAAPVFELSARTYKPNHVTARWPGRQSLSLPDEVITSEAADMHGTFTMAPETSLRVTSASIGITDAMWESSSGWKAGIGRGQASARVALPGDDPTLYDLYFTAESIALHEGPLADLGATADLPPVMEGVTLNAQARFDKPWDRSAIEVSRPQPRHFVLTDFNARWGKLALAASGTLDIDTSGTPTGRLACSVSNWREMVAVAEESGSLDPEIATTLTVALELAARLAGDPETLDIALGFRGGLTYLGPMPIGQAPVIRLD